MIQITILEINLIHVMFWHYFDPIYGEVRFPHIIEELVNTPELSRIRGISLDTVPYYCVPWRVSNRFEHSLGVCSLAQLVIMNNSFDERAGMLLSVSALLHDTGNGPFSHLSEPFMRHLFGKDGESFLADVLTGSKAQSILDKAGISTEEIVQYITGKLMPHSSVLNGSMDIDNLDNVNRYWFTARRCVHFNASLIASSYRFNGNEWMLSDDAIEESRKWQENREVIYDLVYGFPHLSTVSLISRALYLVYRRGRITREFFKFDDDSAMEFLQRDNRDSADLIEQARAHKYYDEVFNATTDKPSLKLKQIAEQWDSRHIIADDLIDRLSLPNSALAIYSGRGSDRRRISLPFVRKDGSLIFDNGNHDPLYRIKVYLHPEFGDSVDQVVRIMRNLIL